MTVFKSRSRMISVRLSEDEYVALLRLCSTTGARSVSDLTRDAMRAFLAGSDRDALLAAFMDEVRAEIDKLDYRIEELAKRVPARQSRGKAGDRTNGASNAVVKHAPADEKSVRVPRRIQPS